MSNSVNASVHQHTLSGPGWREIAEYCGRQAIPAGRFLDALCGFLLGRYGGHRQPFTMVASDGPLLVGCAEGGPAGDIAATLRMDAAAAADGGGLGAPRFQARIGPDEARLLLEHAGEGVDGDCLLRRMELVGRQIVGGAARWERLSLLDGAEARRMLRDWNDTAESGPGPHTVHELFEQQARRAPGRVAVVCGGQTLTYGELNVRANQLARHLRQAGAGADTLVGLCVERSLEMIVGLLGILKSGAAYVPLDASYPAERLRHMLEDARPLMLLTQERLLERLPPVDAPALCLDTAWPALAAHSAGDLAPISGPEHLCYVIYTSGSTGKPKGATIQHQGLHNLVRWYIRHYEVSADDRALIFSSISFDLTQKNIFAMLAVGAQVHLPADGYAPDLAFRQIEEEGITILNCATRAFYPLLSYQTPERPLRLRQVLIGGEVVNSQLLADAFRHTARPPLFHNTYGPTETSDINCSFQFDPREPQDNVPLGLPIDNTRFYVLDAWLNPVPPGVPGELHIGGVCVGRGYLRRPGLTAEKFIPDPFCGEPGARMYKSGDLARQRADGTVEFLGRIDQQVKIRGFRIEPGEIEAALTALPGVREAAVLAREDSPGDKRLVAYAVARDGAALDPAALRAGLAASLPEHMVPAHYVLLERLPLTPNGKTDRKALPAPDLKRGDDGYTAPAGATAQALAAIWADTLGLDRVGADDNFFALGGHSLLATQVLSKLRAAFGLELPVRALFEAPTVAALAARVDSALQGGVSADLAPIAPAPAGVPPRLSFAQQRLWFLDQYEPGSPFYNMPFSIRFSGELDVEHLRRALNTVVERHDALRTRFAVVDGAPVQQVTPHAELALPATDLSALPEAERHAEAHRLALAEAAAPFDLAVDMLIRWSLLRLSPGEHVLLLTMHHIVSDGWSMGVLLRELTALYAAFAAGRPSPLAPLPLQYADFAHWQRQWLTGDVQRRQLDYWTAQLAGAPTLLELPTDRPRPPVQRHRGATLSFTVDAATTGALYELGRRARTTLFVTLTAAFQALLHRYSGQRDICIGAPIANRNRGEIEDLIGFFVNTLVLRARVDGAAPFADLLAQAHATALDAYAHQDLPLDQLVEALKPERHLSHAPLFQVVLALQNAPTGERELPGVRVDTAITDTGSARFDLLLNVTETAGRLDCAFEYNTDLFDAATIERLRGHWLRLLQAVAADPDTPVGLLPLLDDGERHRQLVEWNDTAAPYPSSQDVHQLFEAQAARTPDGAALAWDGGTVSYAELNARANRLARRLLRHGAAPDTRVALCLERGTDLIVALLAILKAGAAYVPLDPAYPAARLAHMLADAAPVLLLTESALLERLPVPAALPVLCLDADNAGNNADAHAAPVTRARVNLTASARASADDGAIRAHADAPPPANDGVGDDTAREPAALDGNLAHASHPERLCYVLYTSGSTGQPKGVAISHRNVLRLVHGGYCELGPERRVLQFAPVSFDASTFEIWGALLNGACLVLAPPGPCSVADLGLTITGQRVDTAWFTAALFNQMVEHQLPALSGMRHILAGGEPLSPAHAQALLAANPSILLSNGYGPTETTTFACHHPVTAGDDFNLPLPLGRPIANTAIYILDAWLNPVPAGVAGELHIGGPGVGRGYLSRPAMTAEKFIPDPFSGQPGARMYKSGDLARRRADGTIEYLGRIDQQVKIRGFRIEPGEIEAALAALPGVREAAVLAREDVPGDKRLVAYFVAADGAALDPAALRAALAAALPDYMVPSHFVPLERMPLTPNGKTDRKALPAPDLTRGGDGYTAPRGHAEETLAAIWADILGLDRVGADDNFFALGGHSLLATQAMSKVRAAFKVELPVRALFEAPTVAALARRLDTARQGKAADATGKTLAAIPRAPAGAPLQLSFAQQRLWFLDQYEPGSPFYNMPFSIRFSGELDVEHLRRALNTVVERHDALRTRFAVVDGAPVQQVTPHAELALPATDLSALPEAERHAEAHRLALAEAAAPFDLAADMLIRWSLLRLSPGEHVLLLTMHHIVSDGWSMGVLLRELTALYAAFAAGRPSPLAPLPLQYADFAHWQRQWLTGDVQRRQLDYWTAQLAGAPTLLELPTDRPRPPVQRHRGATLSFTVDAATTGALYELGRRARTTLFVTLTAAFQALLHRYSGQRDICIGAPIANRNRGEIEDLIGFFVNTLVLRARVDGAAPFADLLAQAHATALDAYAHQDLPLDQLVEALKPERHLSHAPLFQVVLALQNAPTGERELPGVRVDTAITDTGSARFDLLLNVTETAGRLDCAFEYNTDLFDAATIERLRGHWLRLLQAVAADPDTPVGLLPLLDDGERHQQLVEWNDTAAPYPSSHGVHQLFEAQAARTPDGAALAWDGGTVSYAELNARANRLARRLLRHSAAPDTRVALCLERGPDLIVALLAILKAGAAYVPLDPAYPAARLAHMLADAAPVLLLTDSILLARLPLSAALPVLCLDADNAGNDADAHAYPATRARVNVTASARASADDGAIRPHADVPPATNGAIPPAALDANLAHASHPERLCYVLYTSGSTGQPKGVAISHRNVLRLVHGGYCELGPERRVLQFAPVSFDASTFEIWGALLNGACLVLAPPGPCSVADLGLTITGQRVDTAWFTAALFNQMVEHQLPALSGMRHILAGGEPLSPAHAQALLASNPSILLSNGYGPTETTTFACHHPVTAGDDFNLPLPLGRPIANTAIHILDAWLNPVPTGVAGELHIGGPGVGRGYLNRPAMTAEKFIPDPFCGQPGARMYKSGDLARRRADGTIEYLGRIDQQVKIRGFRIEPGEIEAALAALPGVREAAVLAREDVPGDKRLVAYFVAAEGAALDPAALRAALAAALPDYMVPSHFVPLERMPLTPNGKTDRKALPAPDLSRISDDYAAPQTPGEERFCAVWQQVLGLPRVGIHDNFFAIGGHSLLAVKLLAALAAGPNGAALSIKDLYLHPTVAELARHATADTRTPQ